VAKALRSEVMSGRVIVGSEGNVMAGTVIVGAAGKGTVGITIVGATGNSIEGMLIVGALIVGAAPPRVNALATTAGGLTKVT
jgi:hypothetical protein